MTEFTTGNGVIVRVVGSGPAGLGVPVGGTTGQVLAKVDGTDYNTAWTTPTGGGGVSDGDKGDITVSGSGATWTVDAGSITLAKHADMATASLVYRKTAGAGAPEVNTLATLKTDLGLTGTNSGDQASIVGITGTKAQFNTACTDGDFLFNHAWTAIETIDPAGQYATFTSIPTTFTDLMIEYWDASHDSGTAQFPYIQVSQTNGSAWISADVTNNATHTNTVKLNGQILLLNYSGSRIAILPLLGANTADGTMVRTSTPMWLNVRADAGINAIRVYWGAGNFDGGSRIILKGR